MRLLYGHSEEVARWVAQRIPDCDRGFGECQAFGIINDAGFLGGVVFHNWNPECGTIEVSAAAKSPKWARPHIITELFSYAFGACGCRIVIARQSERNTRARKLWRAFGAKEYVIPDLRADGEAETIFTLKNEDWQKSRLHYGKK